MKCISYLQIEADLEKLKPSEACLDLAKKVPVHIIHVLHQQVVSQISMHMEKMFFNLSILGCKVLKFSILILQVILNL